MINFSRSMKGRCHGNRFFCANQQKLAYLTFILRAGIPQQMGDRNMDADVNIADDPSMSDKNLNFGPVTRVLQVHLCTGQTTYQALPCISNI